MGGTEEQHFHRKAHRESWDAIIIGGGACGLMCAAQAALQRKNVLLLERNLHLGAKILISGGGRCNFTNLYTDIENFVSQDPGFAKTAFQKWSVEDTIYFFKKFGGIAGEEKTLGQLFPTTNKAKDIVQVFVKILENHHQDVLTGCSVQSVDHSVDKRGARMFQVRALHQGREEIFRAPKVVLASGGLPVAKLGASDFALKIAKQFGSEIIEPAPALVPLVITGKDNAWYAALAGNSIFARVTNEKIQFEENILFTHWGLSGPAILQISSYWRPGETIWIDFLPNHSVEKLIQAERQEGGKKMVAQVLQPFFTKRMIEALSGLLPLDRKIASLGKSDAKYIAQTLHKFAVKPATDKGYDKAEVMRGGIATSSLNPETLEFLEVPGLFAGGEAVDMTGWLGGYNFQWAWASGFAIATAL